jgi:hypothetical protein
MEMGKWKFERLNASTHPLRPELIAHFHFPISNY